MSSQNDDAHARNGGPAGGPGRARRAVAVIAKAAGLAVVFALSAAAGAVLHLGLPAERRFATERVNGMLAGSFKGKVTILHVGGLHLTRIEGVDAEVFDPDGHRVLALHGVGLRFATLTLLRSLVSGDRLVVRLPELTVDQAEVVLEQDAAGELSIQRAFASPAPSTPGRGSEISLPDIRLRHAWIHGHLASVPTLDADLNDFAGAFTSTPATTAIDVKHLAVVGRGIPGLNPEGSLEASVSLPDNPEGETRARARYEGRVGEIPVRAEGSLIGKEVVAIVDVAQTEPGAFAALAPGKIHLGAPVTAHAEVHGTLPVLRPELRARIGDGDITASGTVTLPESAPSTGPQAPANTDSLQASRTEIVAAGKVSVANLDISLLQEGLPRSRLTAVVDASVVSRPGGKLSGTYQLANEVGEVSGQVVPAIQARGEFTEQSVRGTAEVAERGAPTAVAFSLDPRAGSSSPSQLAVKTDTTVPDLNGIPRVGPIGRGHARLEVDGHLDLDTKQASARAAGEVGGLALKGVQLAHAMVTATVDGPLESPHLVAQVQGTGLRAVGYGFTSVRVTAGGSLHELDLTTRMVGDAQSPSVAASAHVSRGADIVVRGARIELQREDVTSTSTIAQVRVAGGTVDVRGMTVLGLGSPVEVTARISPAGLTVKAKGDDVDLARVTKLLAREEDARGHLAFDVDATAGRHAVSGHVNADVRDLAARGIEGGTVHVATTFDKTHMKGDVQLALGDVGRLDISTTDIELGGAATQAEAWRTATGTAAISGSVDLAHLLAMLPVDARPVDAAGGTIAIQGQASRPYRSVRPSVDVQASTTGLSLLGKQETTTNADGSLTLGPEPWRTTGLDGSFGVKLDGVTGATSVTAKLHDTHGPLASLDASATLPLTELLKTPDRMAALVRDMPLDAKVVVPRRALDAMPAALGKLPMTGDVEIAAELRGTANAPQLTLNAKGANLLPRNAATCVRPIDLESTVAYDGEKADVHLTAARDGEKRLVTDATVKVSLAQAMAGGAIPWEASADVALTRFPLDAIGPLVSQPITGDLSGKIAIKDLHRAASLEADLDLRALSLEHIVFPTGKVHVVIKDGGLNASARLDQTDGYVETQATGAMTWGAALSPGMDLVKPIDVTLHAKNFRASAAMPFVQGVFTELDGRIDTDAKIHIDGGGKNGKMDGAVTLRDGVFEVPQIGERFHGLKGRMVIKPWGTLRFDDFSAQAPTGKITGSAEAALKGLSLQNATAHVHIARGESLPIAVEGVPMGHAYGDITTHAQMTADGKRLDVDVDIPVLHVALPQSTGHSLQALDADNTVRIGLHSPSRREFIALPVVAPEKPRPPSALAIRAVVKLGHDVEVRRDTTVQVVATGETTIDVTDKTHVGGSIRVTRGRLELEGKQFVIDRGEVSFVGDDPANPLIVATAYWDAPNGTRVFADFTGRVSSGKLVLRAEPSLSQDEILALIMFGSPDGSFGAEAPPGQQDSTGAKAAGLAGGVVTQGLNKAISGITRADITTRVDTSQSNNPRPELAVQISKKVSARISYKLGVPAPGDNPDRTELALDWRFIRNWSLVTTVGDQGSTALDVVWRKRY